MEVLPWLANRQSGQLSRWMGGVWRFIPVQIQIKRRGINVGIGKLASFLLLTIHFDRINSFNRRLKKARGRNLGVPAKETIDTLTRVC